MNKLETFLQSNPYFQPGEKVFLQSLIIGLPQKNPLVLEIGTFKGWSAITMARIRKDIRIITLDPHIGIPEDGLSSSPEEVINNVSREQLRYNILHLQIPSQDFNPKNYAFRGNIDKFDLIFIDGDHTFEGVKHDFEKFLPFVKKDGFILFHDYGNEEGVTKFCNTLGYNLCQRFRSMLVIRKRDLC